jgi:hypothetical protein
MANTWLAGVGRRAVKALGLICIIILVQMLNPLGRWLPIRCQSLTANRILAVDENGMPRLSILVNKDIGTLEIRTGNGAEAPVIEILGNETLGALIEVRNKASGTIEIQAGAQSLAVRFRDASGRVVKEIKDGQVVGGG